jgi:hypothetical protein
MGHDDEEAASSAMPHGGARWAHQKTVLNNAPIKERLKWLVQLIFADADFNGQLPVYRRADHFGVCNVLNSPWGCASAMRCRNGYRSFDRSASAAPDGQSQPTPVTIHAQRQRLFKQVENEVEIENIRREV